MLLLKSGVSVKGVQPEILLALLIVDQIYRDYGAPCMVTSCTEEVVGRKENSLHPKGLAVDLRTKHWGKGFVRTVLLDQIKRTLGTEYDVVYEAEGQPEEHLHIEFDPKLKED